MLAPGRLISARVLVPVVIAYLAIIQVVGRLLTRGLDHDHNAFPDVGSLARTLTIPVAFSVVFVLVVISVLKIWPQVIAGRRGLNRWVWVVPALMLLSVVIVTDYQNLGSVPASLTIVTIVSVLLVGTGEELIFRGVVVTSLRAHQISEVKVAIWSSAIFGAAHLTNLISGGTSAVPQALIASFSGFFFYLAHRLSGTLMVPILIHALWDFSLFSGTLGTDTATTTWRHLLPIVINLTLVAVVLVRRHKIGISMDDRGAAAAAH